MAGTAGLEMQVDKDKQFLPSRTLYACEYTPSVTHRAYDSGVFSLSHLSGFIFKIYEEHRRAVSSKPIRTVGRQYLSLLFLKTMYAK